jgi:hypothetical protein
MNVRVALVALVAAAVGVPLAAGAVQPVVYGKAITLSGQVPSQTAGEAVIVLARPYGQSKFHRVGATTTTRSGRWAYDARPAIQTTYIAAWGGTTTETVEVHVSPRLDLNLHGGVLTATARTVRSLRGRAVFVQLRRDTGTWRGVLRLVLDASSSAKSAFAAPHGRSELRLYMPKSEAGAGYEAGYSGVFVYSNGA